MSSDWTIDGRSPAEPLDRPAFRSNGWWGMALLIATESALFTSFVASYFYLRFRAVHWPPRTSEMPHWHLALASTAGLLISALLFQSASAAAAQGAAGRMRTSLAVGWACGLASFGLQYLQLRDEWSRHRPSDDTYSSMVYLLIGGHWLHVGVGLLIAGFVTYAALRARVRPGRHAAVQVTALYWWFLAVLGVVVSLATLSPLL
jgi:cytochrome c oxidase subunit 3